MLELGQPLHAFDMDRLAGPGIVVRRGERRRAPDHARRRRTDADADDLLICDLERPVAIAGVMGGADLGGVGGHDERAAGERLLHARRHPVTARRLDLHTEASHRFERGTDPEGTDAAAARSAALIAAWAGGEVLAGLAAAGEPPARRHVPMRAGRASALLGYPVSTDDALAVFGTLGMHARVEAETVEVEVPGYRVDIEREVDLIEEVVRIQGYGRVGSHLPRAAHAGALPEVYALARRAKDALVRAGLREIRPAPFASQAGPRALRGPRRRPASRTRSARRRGSCGPGSRRGCCAPSPVTRRSACDRRACSRSAPCSGSAGPRPTSGGSSPSRSPAPSARAWASEKRPFDVLDATRRPRGPDG